MNLQALGISRAVRPLADLREEIRWLPRPPVAESQELALEALQRTLDRMLTAKERLDTKAAVIPAAIGAIGAIVIGRVAVGAHHLDVQTFMAAVSGSAALVATVYALSSLSAASHAVGPKPTDLAQMVDTDLPRFRQRVVIETALAVHDAAAVVAMKGIRLNLALFSGAVAALAILGLGITGGLT